MRLASILVFLIACHATLPGPDTYKGLPNPQNKEIVLGVGDVLSINVWGEKDLNTEGTIRPDGTITMPLVGDLKAEGQTPTQLKQTIKAKLGSFIKLNEGTEITVAVKAWKSYRFTLSGEVGKPNVYTSDQYVTVADAIAMAGGLTRFAKRDGIKVIRRTPNTGNLQEIPVDYDAIASGQRPDMNFYVLPGDTIWVP